MIFALQLLTLFAGLIGLVSAIFWMIVGWRAMKAHEAIAFSLERLSKKNKQL